MSEIAIVAAKRSGVGSFLGSLAPLSAPEIGAQVIKALLDESNISGDEVSEVIMGNVLTTGVGQNPARQAAIKAGIAEKVPATTVNVVCGSGLKAIHMAAQAIMCGDADIVVAGGQESMSNSPHFAHIRQGNKMGDLSLVDSMIFDGLTDVYHHYHMGITAENIAKRCQITRELQDELALASQQKAAKAQAEGKFKEEITPIIIPSRRGEDIIFEHDEYIKTNTSVEKLSQLRPAFKKDGTVTAGNASGINDGAAAVIMMSVARAKHLGLPILAKVKAYASMGVSPEVMGLGPVGAVKETLRKAQWSLEEVDLIESNEAFAAQALGVAQQLDLDLDKVNVNGGAIAIGHPIGASGARILVTLLHEMKRQSLHKGLATLCVGGGMGLAIAVERE